jgi:hypothetical protein
MKLGLCAVSMGAAVVALSSLYCMAAKKANDKPAKNADGKKTVLFYSESFGFPHSVVKRQLTGEMAYAEKMLKEICGKAGYDVRVTQTFKNLEKDGQFKDYDAIVLYTTGNPLIDRDGLLKWLRNGGALIGIHTATDTFHHPMNAEVPMTGAETAKLSIPDWPEYTKIIGAAFKTHGAQQTVTIKIDDPNHPATKHIEAGWQINDEIYQFDRYNKDVHLLLSIDTDKISDASLKKLKMTKGEFYPVSWTNTEGKGRVFYTSLGHREDVWTNPVWQQHLLGGMAWALGQTDK